MKVRVDVCLGQDLPEIDLSFLTRRETWLPGTGIYLEFNLKGTYTEGYDFKVESDVPEVVVTKYSWNRFFINIQQSGIVTFSVVQKGVVVVSKEITFKVSVISVPLIYSVNDLLCSSVADIRFFANRLADNTINGTRFSLFTTRNLEGLCSMNLQPNPAFWRIYELILSILTERGLKVYITPYDYRTLYTFSLITSLKDIMLGYMDRSAKFKVVWDMSSGLRKKELGSTIDIITNRFGKDIKLAVRADMFNKVGGEGFAQSFVEFRLKDRVPGNDRGIKIARIKDITRDYFAIRTFAKQAVENGWGVEYSPRYEGHDLRKIQYSLSRAMYIGYLDAVGEDKSD